jgi:hypothetical protein
MRIFRETFVELPENIWKPLWRSTLVASHPCPLTSGMVARSYGQVTIPVTFSLDGVVHTEELEVLFEENSPSLSSEASRCFGAAICIRGTAKWMDLEIIKIG